MFVLFTNVRLMFDFKEALDQCSKYTATTARAVAAALYELFQFVVIR